MCVAVGTTFEVVCDEEENISIFFSYTDVFFPEKLMTYLYSENILISTLPVSVNTINVIKYF
jgi:hypothetical protein